MSEVTIRANDHEIVADAGNSLLRAIMDAGIPIDTACGGQARCHLCRVTITEGREGLNEANPIEYKALGNVLIAQGMRLACQVEVTQPLAVTVPEPRPKRRRGPPPRTPKTSVERRSPSRSERPTRGRKPAEARTGDAETEPRDEKAREAVSSEEPRRKKRRGRRPRRRNKSEAT